MASSRIEELKVARDLMWDSIEAADPERRAPLMNQWRALESTIANLSAKTDKAGDSIDEIAARRAARGGSTSRLGEAERRAR